jgi:hypothetical protein
MELNERNTRLAHAMGFKEINDWHKGTRKIVMATDGPIPFLLVDFADDPDGHWCKHQLLKWMATQPKPFVREFYAHLVIVLGLAEHLKAGEWLGETLLALQTATPEQIAIATDQAISERR